jgi:hypothetical protein
VGERDQAAIERGDDRARRRVARRGTAALDRESADLSVNVRDRRSRLPQRESLGQLDELRGRAPRAAVGAPSARQAGEPVGAEARQPAPRRALRYPGRVRSAGERNAVLEVRAQRREALKRSIALRVREFAQRHHQVSSPQVADRTGRGGLGATPRWR